jgi:polysaccharide export outer membrane protein
MFAVGVCLAQTVFAQQTIPAVNTRGYLVGPGDVIEGKVLGERDYDFTATVDEDGNFEVPFFDKPVPAMCRTEKDLRMDVTKLISKYVRNPQVSVQVKERKSRPPATIYGEVRAQQRVDLQRKARLLDLLAFAGGVTEKAGGMIQVFRTQPLMCGEPGEINEWKAESNNGTDVPSRIYSLSSVRLGQDESNPVIYPGDIIVVQKAPTVYVIGQVMALKEISLTEGGLSLTEALAQAGGFNREAKTKDVKIRRLKANSREREIISVNFDQIRKGQQKDIMLEPNDIVEVDKSKKGIGEILLEVATGGLRNVANLPMTRF